MKVKIGKPVRWYSTSGLDSWYMKRRGFTDTNGKVANKFDDGVFKAIDIWQSILNGTINAFNEWKGRKVSVKIDHFDTWSMDHTLAYMIVPMLKQLKETKHGAPLVANKDVPKELRYDEDKPTYDVDEHWFERWDYVLDEMIWAFEWKRDEVWEEDDTKRRADEKRAAKAFKLFGKYYQGLWD